MLMIIQIPFYCFAYGFKGEIRIYKDRNFLYVTIQQ